MKKTLFTLFCTVLLTRASYAAAPSIDTPAKPAAYYVAIVIDDFGNGGADTETLANAHIEPDVQAMMDLPIPLTGAVIPGQPHAPIHAQLLKEKGHGIIVHLPMAAKKQKASWDTPFTIAAHLSDEAIRERVKSAIEHVGVATGLNNHTGSAATEDLRAMTAVAREVASQGMILLDSVTSGKSKLPEAAQTAGLNTLVRDVFLDNGKGSMDFTVKRMQETLTVAKKQGHAIAIGHVGPSGGMSTVNGIASMIEYLEKEGVVFVTLDELHAILYSDVFNDSEVLADVAETTILPEIPALDKLRVPDDVKKPGGKWFQ